MFCLHGNAVSCFYGNARHYYFHGDAGHATATQRETTRGAPDDHGLPDDQRDGCGGRGEVGGLVRLPVGPHSGHQEGRGDGMEGARWDHHSPFSLLASFVFTLYSVICR